MQKAEAIEILGSYGLTEYESRAYMALVELESGSAREVGEVARIPRTKVYSVLEGMTKKRLVEVIPERPRRYVPSPMEAFFEQHEIRFREELARVKEHRKQLDEILASTRKVDTTGAGQFRVFRGRKSVLNKMMNLIEDAKEEVHCLSGVYGALRLNYASPMIHDKELTVRLQLPIENDIAVDVREAMQYADVRDRPTEATAAMILIVDNAQALVTHYIPDDTHLFRGEDVAMWTDDPVVVADLHSMAKTMWTLGAEAEEVLSEAKAEKKAEKQQDA